MKPYHHNLLLLLLLLLLLSCSDKPAASSSLHGSGMGVMNFKISSIGADFEVRLPDLGLATPCDAIAGAKQAQLTLTLSDNSVVQLSGALKPESGGCASADLIGQAAHTFTSHDIVETQFTLLASDGRNLGLSGLIGRQTMSNGTELFELQFMMGNRSNRFSTLTEQRVYHTATKILLPGSPMDGKVLATGGLTLNNLALASTLLFNADGTAFETGPALHCGRYGHVAIWVELTGSPLDKKMIIAGGRGNCTEQAQLEVYDPMTNSLQLLTSNYPAGGTPTAFATPRYDLNVSRLDSANQHLLLFTGGRAASNDVILPPSEAAYTLDLYSLKLLPTANPNIDKSVMPFALTGQQVAVVPDPLMTGGETIALITTGIKDDLATPESFNDEALIYFPEFHNFYRHSTHLPDISYFRAEGAGLFLTKTMFGIIGGLSPIVPPATTYGVNDTTMTLELQGNNLNYTLLNNLQLPQPLFGAQAVNLALDSSSSTNLVAGGATSDTANGYNASNLIQYLVVTGSGKQACFKPLQFQDPVSGVISSMKLFQPRYGHTATLLNNGSLLVLGGLIEQVQPMTAMHELPQDNQASMLTLSYEILPLINYPTTCP